MSIILRALKKLQEEEAKQPGNVSPEAMEKNDAARGESILLDAENNAASDTVEPDTEWVPGYSDRHPPTQQVTHQAFGFGPKALLILVMLLGVFTTGWFTNRIYLSTKTAPGEEKPSSRVDVENTIPKKAVSTESSRTKPSTAIEKTVSMTETHAPALEPVRTFTEIPPAAQKPEKADPEIVAPLTKSQPPRQKKPEAEEPVPKKRGRPELKINAIAWRAEEPRAIVNMQRVYEGDVIEGATVLAIQRKAILFKYNGTPFEVRF